MFADVLIDHAFARKKALSYSIPEGLAVEVGDGVLVPFQKGKKAALVLRVHNQKPPFQTRPIEAHLDPKPLLQAWQIQLAEWISEHYFCSMYDTLRLMLPKHIWRVPKQKRQTEGKEQKKKKANEKKHTLTKEQAAIVQSILSTPAGVSLLHGVTGSGKTEVYKRIIEEKVENGQQALLLVPEISLTPQLLHYFKDSFPNLAVIHSRVSQGKRAEIWRKVRANEIKLVIGSRSALFSPFKDLGVIILDEEHEWSYKQEQSPRYHGRKVALKMQELTGAQLILGSATPSIESMWHAQNGDYQLYTLEKRIQKTPLPQIDLVDMREELEKKNFSIFSDKLEQKIRSTLEKGEQTLLFLNRRGSASSTVCRDCGQAVECQACDVKLTYHAQTFGKASLICHHCGRIEANPKHCPQCGSHRIRHLGIGTQRVVKELENLFPKARIARADRDSMSQKESHHKLYQRLIKGEIDILVGTQMVTKGLDIPNLSLVGVVLADLGLHTPDFRASERNFQQLTQVAGRAGRRQSQGEVIIQSYSPEHIALQKAKEHDYLGFYQEELANRTQTHFPPFGDLAKIILLSSNKKNVQAEAEDLKHRLNDGIHEVFAAPAFISRVNHKYYWNIFIQGPDPAKLLRSKLSQEELEKFRIDIDPVHMV